MKKQEINDIEVEHDIITWKMQCDDPEDEEEIGGDAPPPEGEDDEE